MDEFKDDVRYKQGRKMLTENNYESAIEFFSELLQSRSQLVSLFNKNNAGVNRISVYGEQSIEVAPAWFEYGRALLLKEQENPSDDLLGAMAAEARKQAQALGDELSGGVDDEDVGEEEEGVADGAPADESAAAAEDSEEVPVLPAQDTEEDDEPSDMEIAWEALEVSRKIFETEGDPTHDEFLSEVYEALGDVSRFNGNFQGAIEEYKKCVQLREAALDDSDRLLAQAHYSLAVAYIYNAGEEGADPLTNKKAALRSYQAAQRALTIAPSVKPSENASSTTSSSSQSPGPSSLGTADSELLERKELSDEIEETIEALKQEIKELVRSSSGGSGWRGAMSSAASASSSTTIGFGSSSTVAAPTSTTTVGFGSSSTSAAPTSTTTVGFGFVSAAAPSSTFSAGAVPTAAVPVMAAKRKAKPDLDTPTPSTDHTEKKPKLGELVDEPPDTVTTGNSTIA